MILQLNFNFNFFLISGGPTRIKQKLFFFFLFNWFIEEEGVNKIFKFLYLAMITAALLQHISRELKKQIILL